MYMQKVSWRFQKFARYTRSLKAYAIIVLYIVSLIGPLQPAIHVIQNRNAGEQRKHWDKRNKELILFKMVKKIKRLFTSSLFWLFPRSFHERYGPIC